MSVVPPPRIVFFSSKSENTLRAINRINLPALRIPLTAKDPFLEVNHDYILFVPTYGAGKTMGAIPMAVRRFFNESEANRNHCVGVIGGGNTTFSLFATAGDLIGKKLGVPCLYKFEVLGMPHEIEAMREIMFSYFPELEKYRQYPPNSFTHSSIFK